MHLPATVRMELISIKFNSGFFEVRGREESQIIICIFILLFLILFLLPPSPIPLQANYPDCKLPKHVTLMVNRGGELLPDRFDSKILAGSNNQAFIFRLSHPLRVAGAGWDVVALTMVLDGSIMLHLVESPRSQRGGATSATRGGSGGGGGARRAGARRGSGVAGEFEDDHQAAVAIMTLVHSPCGGQPRAPASAGGGGGLISATTPEPFPFSMAPPQSHRPSAGDAHILSDPRVAPGPQAAAPQPPSAQQQLLGMPASHHPSPQQQFYVPTGGASDGFFLPVGTPQGPLMGTVPGPLAFPWAAAGGAADGQQQVMYAMSPQGQLSYVQTHSVQQQLEPHYIVMPPPQQQQVMQQQQQQQVVQPFALGGGSVMWSDHTMQQGHAQPLGGSGGGGIFMGPGELLALVNGQLVSIPNVQQLAGAPQESGLQRTLSGLHPDGRAVQPVHQMGSGHGGGLMQQVHPQGGGVLMGGTLLPGGSQQMPIFVMNNIGGNPVPMQQQWGDGQPNHR